MLLEGFTAYDAKDAERYTRLRWWAGLTFGDILDKAADVYPEKEAIVDDSGRYTYARIREKSDRLAIGLYHLGLQPLDRVLLQLPNWHEFVVAYFALQKIGAIPVVLIARYRQYEIDHLARLSGATAWIVAERFGKTDYLPIIEDVLRDHPQITLTLLCRREQHRHFPDLNDVIDQTVLDEGFRRLLKDLRPDPMQVAHMGPTGGTTGLPKLAPHTHNNYLCKVEYSARASEFNQNTACLVVLPAAHDLPFANGICATLFACGRLVLQNRTDPDSICRAIQDEKINTVLWVPTLAYRVLTSPRLDCSDLSSLKTIYCGGGASSPELIKTAVEKLKCSYICGYGGTEGMLVTTRCHDDLNVCCRTIGKPTCPYDSYRVVDDAGRDLPPGINGNLVVKGPSIFTGYFNQSRENAQVFTPDGYFRTGDLAAIDSSGYISLCGRSKDTIKRGGETIFPAEIEKLIEKHPDVAIASVVGMPDPEMGERICAYIQKEPGKTLTAPQVIQYVKDQKASVLQLPERIEFMENIPLTATGKIDKLALKADIIRKLGLRPDQAQKQGVNLEKEPTCP